MKVVLINPPMVNTFLSEAPKYITSNVGNFPPLGLMYIASYLRNNYPVEIKILDALNDGLSYRKIAAFIKREMPNLIGITVHSHSLLDAINVAKIAKKIDKGIHISFGGPHVNIFPQQTIAIPEVDSVFWGEVEESFKLLVETLDKKKTVDTISDGIFLKYNGEVRIANSPSLIKDLDSLPFPARDLIVLKKYNYILGLDNFTTTMITGRGCLYRCAFCSTPRGNFRQRSVKNILEEIRECLSLGIKEIYFVDDNFGQNTDWLSRFCDEIAERKLKFRWGVRARLDGLTPSVLEKMKESGCYRIQIGVETSSDEGLRILRKGSTLKEIEKTFKIIKELKITTVAYFMLGCPHERNKYDIMKTIKFAMKLDPDFAQFNILTLYPDTELYRMAEERKIVPKNYWQAFASFPTKGFVLPFWTQYFTREQLCSFLGKAYRKFYLRPSYIIKHADYCFNYKNLIKCLRVFIPLEILKILMKRAKFLTGFTKFIYENFINKSSYHK